jgi:hypothetical protein
VAQAAIQAGADQVQLRLRSSPSGRAGAGR